MLGVTYITDSIVAAMMERAEQTAYRVYETDCLYLICCALGNNPGKRYYHILNPIPEDKRSGMEIAEERLDRYGIEVVD